VSYQAITDIIVNPAKLQDLQLSKTVNDSPDQSSISFADYLQSYNKQEISKTETQFIEGNNESLKSFETDKTEISEKSNDNKVAAGKESEKTAEKNDVKDSSKPSEEKKISRKEDDEKNIKKEVIKNPEIELTARADEKKAAKESDKTKKVNSKKLSGRDFSRLDELTEKNPETSPLLAAGAQEAVKAGENSDVKSQKDKLENDELTVNADARGQLADISLQKDENKTDMSFDFSGENEKQKNQFNLDKEGKITVEDQRTKVVSEEKSEKPAIKVSEIKLNNNNSAVMTVEVNPNAEADVLSLNTQTAASNGSNYQTMLTNQMQNIAPEFVKAGNIILKDNNQGSINLILHPDDLGNVKIHLSLDGKSLSGHITVATKEALQVFKDNSETLREAFIKNGFENAKFDVAFNNGGQFNQNMNSESQNSGTEFIAKNVYKNIGGALDSEIENLINDRGDISNYSVNIVA